MPVKPILKPHPEGVRPRLTDAMAEPPDAALGKAAAEDAMDALSVRLEALQAALGAEATRSLLVVLQARDAGGKDGLIRRVFGKLNPALCTVSSFKRPTLIELRHDYLWRVHQVVPPRGTIGVFNRSHYEEVLTVRVHGLQPKAVCRRRYKHINAFERMLVDEGVVIRKFFLHVSKEEQRKRLEERLDDATKNWKFEVGDLAERALWDAYSDAYEEMLHRCSTSEAPWYIVPADRNKARDLLVTQVVVEALEQIDPKYPKADPEVLKWRGKIE
jgi:PPK2 family polyphosphate:nucleotide phosphotransferase